MKMGRRGRMPIERMEVKALTRRGLEGRKLSFEELLVKYKKEAEVNVTDRPKKVQSSRLPLKRKSQEWNW